MKRHMKSIPHNWREITRQKHNTTNQQESKRLLPVQEILYASFEASTKYSVHDFTKSTRYRDLHLLLILHGADAGKMTGSRAAIRL